MHETRRILSLLLSIVFFLTMGGEGLGYRSSCPHHDAAAQSTANAMHTGGHAEAGTQHHGSEESGHPCSCVGTCTTVGFALPETSRVTTRTVAASYTYHLPFVTADRSIIGDAYLLPFANAPPAFA